MPPKILSSDKSLFFNFSEDLYDSSFYSTYPFGVTGFYTLISFFRVNMSEKALASDFYFMNSLMAKSFLVWMTATELSLLDDNVISLEV